MPGKTLKLMCLALLIAVPAASVLADAFARPDMTKRSFRHLEWNLGAGLGAALFATDHDTGLFFADGDHSQDQQAGINPGVFFGYGVAKEWVLGMEAQWWPGSFTGDPGGEENWSMIESAITARWYPGSVGLCFKGGVGLAFASATLDNAPSTAIASSFDKTGFGALGGVGWEWRLPMQGQVITFGPQVDYHWISLGSDMTATAITMKLQLQWYGNDRPVAGYFQGDRD